MRISARNGSNTRGGLLLSKRAVGCMAFSYVGKILRVDLSDDRIRVENPEEILYRRYFGGRALVSYFLLRETKSKLNPLAENKLIFASGVLTGAPFSGSARNSVGAKSPFTGAYGDAEVGGFNFREGFTAKDDWLPDRFFHPHNVGVKTIVDPDQLQRAKHIYFKMMGWNEETGAPTREKLEELDIAWVATETEIQWDQDRVKRTVDRHVDVSRTQILHYEYGVSRDRHLLDN